MRARGTAGGRAVGAGICCVFVRAGCAFKFEHSPPATVHNAIDVLEWISVGILRHAAPMCVCVCACVRACVCVF